MGVGQNEIGSRSLRKETRNDEMILGSNRVDKRAMLVGVGKNVGSKLGRR